MDMKEAVRAAKSYVAEVYSDENVTSIGLEEVRYDDRLRNWQVTIGFQTDVIDRKNSTDALFRTTIQRQIFGPRKMKIITIGEDGRIISMTDRFLEAVDD